MLPLGSMGFGTFGSSSVEIFGMPFLLLAALIVGSIVISSFVVTRLIRMVVELR